ncbi:MAG: AI-2E family transporter, partial [Vicinamibacteria bacterium]
VLYSMVLVPVVQGLLAIVGFWIFGLPSPFFWGTVLIFAAVIPGIGSPLVWVPAAIYLLVASSWWQGVGLILYGTLIIGVADNIIKPILLHGTARMHTFTAFLSILGGLLTFGPPGILLGPVIFSILLSMVRIRHEHGAEAGM